MIRDSREIPQKGRETGRHAVLGLAVIARESTGWAVHISQLS